MAYSKGDIVRLLLARAAGDSSLLIANSHRHRDIVRLLLHRPDVDVNGANVSWALKWISSAVMVVEVMA